MKKRRNIIAVFTKLAYFDLLSELNKPVQRLKVKIIHQSKPVSVCRLSSTSTF